MLLLLLLLVVTLCSQAAPVAPVPPLKLLGFATYTGGEPASCTHCACSEHASGTHCACKQGHSSPVPSQCRTSSTWSPWDGSLPSVDTRSLSCCQASSPAQIGYLCTRSQGDMAADTEPVSLAAIAHAGVDWPHPEGLQVITHTGCVTPWLEQGCVQHQLRLCCLCRVPDIQKTSRSQSDAQAARDPLKVEISLVLPSWSCVSRLLQPRAAG